ncbi:hypothetical protein NPS29_00895 [Pseudomonas putida]|uniref:hypothetical protein n=1 Tax=Pseudomonas putida TaxID=303 RepID=UPI002363D0FD|nr:hypothetical protein [Pseudomonas putida]MDD1963867.1 hypothetical protein [Pseudomonas putida]
MKDAITTAYSDLIQNQTELTSTLQSLIDEAASRGVSATHITDLQERMGSFHSQISALSKSLMERHDSMENCQRDQD